MKTEKYVLVMLIFVSILSFCVQPCRAAEVKIPEVLKPWVDWVLHDKEEQVACPTLYNHSHTYLCSWPSTLDMALNDTGGRFSQMWLIHTNVWVALPGERDQWPENVRVDGSSAIVLEKNNVPHIELPPGRHTVTGRFTWQGLPEKLAVPPESGLVSLTVNNEKIAFPDIDRSGRLWLKRKTPDERIENRLKIESFRLIEDSIPAEMLLHITLDVSGTAREISTGPLYLPDKFVPLSVDSTLPAKLEENGTLRIQVRPGRYQLRLRLRHLGPLHELTFVPPVDDFWPDREVWSFYARPQLRLVEIKDGVSIDPVRTAMPKAWHNYPAYQVQPGDTLKIQTVKRGNPQPPPDRLSLERTTWLRFDGSGYTIQDNISGEKNDNWRLEMNPVMELGRVSVNGAEQLITRKKGSEKSGVELRNGILDLTADSVYKGRIASLPAVGWDHDFQKVNGRLNLPPGWTLLGSKGIDRIPGTWMQRWTLLDIFIVLIFTVALAKLFSKPLAGIAFVTLVLTYHELGAPRYIWLAVLIGFALLKYLPDGQTKKAVTICQAAVLLALFIIAIPFSIETIKTGIYPQLTRPWASMTDHALRGRTAHQDRRQIQTSDQAVSPEMKNKAEYAREKTFYDGKRALLRSGGMGSDDYSKSPPIMQYDPKANTQTGPGMPGWMPFETIHYGWTGPVTRDQNITFYLIGPKINLVLSFFQVVLVFILGLGMARYSFGKSNGFRLKFLKVLSSLAIPVLMGIQPMPADCTEIPSPEMLTELQQRLLEKDDCFPACADISHAQILIDPETLSMELMINARMDTAVPVPGHVDQWLPRHVMLDGETAQGLLRKDNNLWMLVPAGNHNVRLTGPVRKQNTLQVPFVLKPHQVDVDAQGWSVDGVRNDKTVDAQLQFKRIVEQSDEQIEILQTGVMPPFVSVERKLLLGLVWKVQTRVKRESPTGAGIVLNIPLIPGESVTTEGIRVVDGDAKVSLGADQRLLVWESFLEPSDQILLTHRQTRDWTEIWQVDVSPIWHMEYKGIPVILHKTGTRWSPTWHPWPGEAVRLNISRPVGVEGQTLTIEKSHLALHPGQKTTAAELLFSVNSSKGGQHTMLLPPNAQLQNVTVNGSDQLIRQEGRHVTLPITPGQQDIVLKWLEHRGMQTLYRSSQVDMGAQNVNAGVDIFLPQNRWPLFAGGEHATGPAVLFWSVIFVILIVAAGLWRTGWAPLKLYQWILLGIGMSMGNMLSAVIIAGWLIALGHRKRGAGLEGQNYNLMQLGLAALTVFALGALVYAISKGLLGHPDMNIIGNGSNNALLRWYQDISDHTLPQAWVFSIPMFVYRIAMLLWALWVSFWLVGILKWGWEQFTYPRIWSKAKSKDKENSETQNDTKDGSNEEVFDL